MIIDVELLCADFRPLLGQDGDLVDFLKPLHEENSILRTPVKNEETKKGLPFYRNIGTIGTRETSKCTFFKTKNSVKFPTFKTHNIYSKSKDFDVIRENHIRRYFSVDGYGVINRLKFGFELNLKPLNPENKASKLNSKESFELIKSIFKLPIRLKGYSEESVNMLNIGNYMCEIISDSTKCRSKKQLKEHKKIPLDPDVSLVGATATILFSNKELMELPEEIEDYSISGCPHEGIRIFHYNFLTSTDLKYIKVYFIQYDEDKPVSPNFMHKLKSYLLELRMSFLFMKKTLSDVGVARNKQDRFVKFLLNKIHAIKRNEQYGFIDLKDQDKGEVCDTEDRKKIDKRLSGLYTQILRIS